MVSRPLVSLLPFRELSHFQPRLCVASIFHTTTPPPPFHQPCAATLIFIVYCFQAQRFSPGTASSAILSSPHKLNTCNACTADKQPNTEVMNKSQYSIDTDLLTPGGGLFIQGYFWLFWRIMNKIWCTASCCIMWSRFKELC